MIFVRISLPPRILYSHHFKHKKKTCNLISFSYYNTVKFLRQLFFLIFPAFFPGIFLFPFRLLRMVFYSFLLWTRFSAFPLHPVFSLFLRQTIFPLFRFEQYFLFLCYTRYFPLSATNDIFLFSAPDMCRKSEIYINFFKRRTFLPLVSSRYI